MQEQLQSIRQMAQEQLAQVVEKADLDALKLKLMGKKGELTLLRRTMGQLPAEERPKAGQMINDVVTELTAQMDALYAKIKQQEQDKKLASEAIDVTEPRKHRAIGMQHPISLVQDQMLSVFTSMGFDVVEGPEVEFDLFNFELMNIPKNHPARDAQDTFYIEDNVVLRTHTSPVQARTMRTRKPPIRIVCPGRVYRADEVDATHSPVFHQMEGLVVDEDVTMSDLKGTLDAFAQKLFGDDMTTRFRPSFFPFTEPSAEVDLTCVNCHGKGCRICKGTGWIEVLGAGMVNPKVLEMCGIDSKKYSGFAFGVGLERIAMLRYGITDMRALFEGDVRFLSQFRDD
ncbi:MAG: phenylalanine--tRNA ligase subunit alpha [Christensenellales bacterium]|nr:phenylalanine--tRNA ligase subunit alpha [Christensenellales bacterium]